MYEKDLKEVNRASLSDIEQNPQIAVVPRGGARPPQTKTLPTEKPPTNGVDLSGTTVNLEKVIPYAIGFLLLFFCSFRLVIEQIIRF